MSTKDKANGNQGENVMILVESTQVANTIQYMTVVVPLITAVLTFILTSAFTLYKERKSANIAKRVFFEYAEYRIGYPFNAKVAERHGEGIILLGPNGQNLSEQAKEFLERYGSRPLYSFMVIRNITANDVINVKVRTVYEANKVVSEEFFMPVWKNDVTLYLPQTVFEGDSQFSTNLKLEIIYSTSTFEKFTYSFKRKKNGTYKERMKKRYLGFIWITKVRYYKNQFYKFERVENIKDQDEQN